MRRFSGIPILAKSTIHAVLDRHGPGGASRADASSGAGQHVSLGHRPNDLWCTDYQGEFWLGNYRSCYPLTVTDRACRLLLACEALSSTKETYAFATAGSGLGVPWGNQHSAKTEAGQ
jgi:putative transposase